jgi:DNA (cytosine-5)-methyltransferase 1
VVWENVPGVLSSGKGRDFGTFLGALGELGYGFAYRVLDAQWFGVAQRRRRVFVVGHLGDWRRAAAVLFERESVFGNPPTRGAAGEKVAGSSTRGPRAINKPKRKTSYVSKQRDDAAQCDAVPYDLFQITAPVNRQNRQPGDPCHTLARDNAAHAAVVAFTQNTRDEVRKINGDGQLAGALSAESGSHQTNYIAFLQNQTQSQIAERPVACSTKLHNTTSNGSGKLYLEYTAGLDANSPPPALLCPRAVRRLTPRECERLQGFPDDYTLVAYRNKPAADGPRYRALGNSMAVPVMRWIGERIALVNNLTTATPRKG